MMETKTVRISGIVSDSLVEGPGLRFVVFFQGCPHHCPDCHNKETWDYHGGKEITIKEIINLWQTNKMIDGISFSGGEPFFQTKALLELVKAAKSDNLNVLIYTGFLYEELLLLKDEIINDILLNTDILIDGPFIKELMDKDHRYRGSANQRIINLKKH